MDVSQKVMDRASKISLVLMDSDGVLTDGRILMYSDGSEGRGFSARDGHGIRMGQRGGLMFGIVSGRESPVVADRAEELYITEVHQGIFDKLECYKEILERFELPPEAVCYIGDDLNDVPLIRRVGLGVAVADACAEAQEAATYVTQTPGGRGAVRELVEQLLKSKKRWDDLVKKYLTQ